MKEFIYPVIMMMLIASAWEVLQSITALLQNCIDYLSAIIVCKSRKYTKELEEEEEEDISCIGFQVPDNCDDEDEDD